MKSDELELDYAERKGFLVGKSARLADYYFRREKEAFRKIVVRLSSAKRRKERKEAYNAMMRVCNRRWREKYPGKRKAYYAAYAKANREKINARRRGYTKKKKEARKR